MDVQALSARAEAAAAIQVRRGSVLPFEDHYQQAWLAALEASRNFDPERGIPFEGYAWKAMTRQTWRAERRALSVAVQEVEAALPEKIPGPAPALDDLAALDEWRERVRAALDVTFRASARKRDVAALEIGVASADEIARKWGVRRSTVYKASRRFRAEILRSEIFSDLWAQRPT